jgi:hypothetical protein
MADDIVAELGAWLPGGTGRRGSYDDLRDLVLRARDEVVALRAQVEVARHTAMFATMRADKERANALEEAARECEALGDKPGHDCVAQCAAAIRALKRLVP